MSRTFARAYARIMGYFWLPCPACGEEFGGQEWRDIDGHIASLPNPDDPDSNLSGGIGICPSCTLSGVGCRAWAAVNGGFKRFHIHIGCEFVDVSR